MSWRYWHVWSPWSGVAQYSLHSGREGGCELSTVTCARTAQAGGNDARSSLYLQVRWSLSLFNDAPLVQPMRQLALVSCLRPVHPMRLVPCHRRTSTSLKSLGTGLTAAKPQAPPRPDFLKSSLTSSRSTAQPHSPRPETAPTPMRSFSSLRSCSHKPSSPSFASFRKHPLP